MEKEGQIKPLERLSPMERLTLSIKSAQPIIYVISSEEQRVLKTIVAVADDLGKKRQLFRWDLAGGLIDLMTNIRDDKVTTVDAGALVVLEKGPVTLLQRIGSITVPALFMLHDFHRFFEPSYQPSAVITRMLRNLIQSMQRQYQSIIIISPVFPTLPGEMEREIELIDFGLPQRPEIQIELTKMASSFEKEPSVDVDMTSDAKESLVRAALGLTIDEAKQAFGRSLVHAKTFDTGIVTAQKQQTIRKTQAVEYIPEQVNIQDVGGLDLLKAWLEQRKDSYTDEAARRGVVAPRGILLLGVPGSGKSMVAKAVATIWDYPLVRLDVGSVFGSYLGQSEANMRRALSTAEAVAPCVLWIDEIEKAFGGIMGGQDAGAGRRLFGYFLTWLQEKRTTVFVVATANSFEGLPPELLRQGRFDAIFFIDLPSIDERKTIWTKHITKRRTEEQNTDTLLKAEDYNVALLAEKTDGFSGAEIEQIVISTIQRTFSEGQRNPTEKDFLQGIECSVPLSQTQRQEIEQLRMRAKTQARPASSQQPAFNNINNTSNLDIS